MWCVCFSRLTWKDGPDEERVCPAKSQFFTCCLCHHAANLLMSIREKTILLPSKLHHKVQNNWRQRNGAFSAGQKWFWKCSIKNCVQEQSQPVKIVFFKICQALFSEVGQQKRRCWNMTISNLAYRHLQSSFGARLEKRMLEISYETVLDWAKSLLFLMVGKQTAANFLAFSAITEYTRPRNYNDLSPSTVNEQLKNHCVFRQDAAIENKHHFMKVSPE